MCGYILSLAELASYISGVLGVAGRLLMTKKWCCIVLHYLSSSLNNQSLCMEANSLYKRPW